LIIILVIVVLLFGVNRIGKLGGEFGRSVREFRQGLSGDEPPSDPK
jgi:sec-independent protein translocase protein TatA